MFFLCFKNFFAVVGINFSVYRKVEKTTTTTKGRNHFLWIILYNNWNKIPTTTKKKISFFFHLILLNFVNHSRFVYLFVIFHHYFSSWLSDDEKSFCFFFLLPISQISRISENEKKIQFLWRYGQHGQHCHCHHHNHLGYQISVIEHSFMDSSMIQWWASVWWWWLRQPLNALETTAKKNPSVFACSIN